ncbi:DUF1293 family protein [bacterium 19MO03SA05]|uniref:DUF1293 family protein n=1 Tax=bacterium 19MO03SA05 TaxID=2920620 RepID=A0AAU6VHT0_UNCXX|nr:MULTISPECIES: DUF1293 family protein [unclassified Vibrio]EKO3922092.1 DUF1293 family protein [Vibrio metschnikovii]MDQ2107316.1 DUF1293 domain-containing protein [Vibrio sp. 2017_1457_15]MDQ2160128.1 DUF1293 domain-containing protein [Vibrio sp. 2017_1457_13]
MKDTLFVLGVSIIWNEYKGNYAQLNISRPLGELEIDTDTFKMKRRTIGESGEVSKYDQPLIIDYDYALQLEKCGALVPRREYEFDLSLDMNNPLSGPVIKKLIPVDPEIKKHFEASFASLVNKG